MFKLSDIYSAEQIKALVVGNKEDFCCEVAIEQHLSKKKANNMTDEILRLNDLGGDCDG